LRLIKKLYGWVLRWADTPYAAPALFLLAFSESSFFPVPPDVLLITLALSIPKKSFRYAFICTAGSVIGGILGYYIGQYGYEVIGKPIVEFYHGQQIMAGIKTKYDLYGFWGILIAAITPIPYKIFTIASGVFDFNFIGFVSASVIGRAFRFFIVAGLIWKFGPSIKNFIDKYFNLLTFVFFGLLILGFIILKYVL